LKVYKVSLAPGTQVVVRQRTPHHAIHTGRTGEMVLKAGKKAGWGLLRSHGGLARGWLAGEDVSDLRRERRLRGLTRNHRTVLERIGLL